MAKMKKAKAFLAVGRFGQRLMATVLRTVQKCLKKAFSVTSSRTGDAIASDYEAWRDRFLWQRLHLALWIALILVLTFSFRDIYDAFFHLRELAEVPREFKRLIFVLYGAIVVSLLSCIAVHRTQFGRRHPGFVFLGLSWSITLVEQIWATLNNFALPDILAWFLVFLSQATLMPIRWTLHLVSQLGVLIYYFSVNPALGYKLPPPDSDKPIYSVTLILALFWYCFIVTWAYICTIACNTLNFSPAENWKQRTKN
jgi:hypothetical protein